MKKDILVIAYKFPPMGGVGTRRWAKFSKYFARKGYRVHVITTRYPYRDVLSWEKDVQDENIIVHRLKTAHPPWLFKSKKGLFLRILSKLYRATVARKRLDLDVAQTWARYLIPYAKKIIRSNGIRNVIVTGPPSSLHYTATFIKIEMPQINLIQDYRDSWNSDRDYEYLRTLKHFRQKEKSALMEMFAVLHSDRVVVVTNDMKAMMSGLYREFRDKFHTIYNGYDAEDFQTVPRETAREFNVIFAGIAAFGNTGRAEALYLIAQAIAELNDPYINDHLRLNFYSNLTLDFFRNNPFYAVFRRNFTFHGLIPPGDVPPLIQRHFCCLSINPREDAHGFGTKIFDYMALGKTIFQVTEPGELADLLRSRNQIVAAFNLADIKEKLLVLKNDFLAGKSRPTDYSDFNIVNLTDEYEKLFL